MYIYICIYVCIYIYIYTHVYSPSELSRKKCGQHMATCGNACPLKTNTMATCMEMWPFCENPACPDPVRQPATSFRGAQAAAPKSAPKRHQPIYILVLSYTYMHIHTSIPIYIYTHDFLVLSYIYIYIYIYIPEYICGLLLPWSTGGWRMILLNLQFRYLPPMA